MKRKRGGRRKKEEEEEEESEHDPSLYFRARFATDGIDYLCESSLDHFILSPVMCF